MKLFTAIFLFTSFSTIVGSNIRLVANSFSPEKFIYFKEVLSFMQSQMEQAKNGLKSRTRLDKAFFKSQNPKVIDETYVAYVQRIDKIYPQLTNIPNTEEIDDQEKLLYITCRTDDDSVIEPITLDKNGVRVILSLGRDFFGKLEQQDPKKSIKSWLSQDTAAYLHFKQKFRKEPFSSQRYKHPTNPIYRLWYMLQGVGPVMGTSVKSGNDPTKLGLNNPVTLPALALIYSIPAGLDRPVQGSSRSKKKGPKDLEILPTLIEEPEESEGEEHHQASGHVLQPQQHPAAGVSAPEFHHKPSVSEHSEASSMDGGHHKPSGHVLQPQQHPAVGVSAPEFHHKPSVSEHSEASSMDGEHHTASGPVLQPQQHPAAGVSAPEPGDHTPQSTSGKGNPFGSLSKLRPGKGKKTKRRLDTFDFS